MEVTTINAELFARMFLAGANNLEAKKEWINELNVFPVPDGDTGTNMSMTIMSAAKEVAAIENPTMASLAKAISSGSLRGARGNSGVILSQLFRGFTKVIAEYDELNVQIISDAFQKATETAYKAVMKPKEGTILTVAKGMSDKAAELGEETGEYPYKTILKQSDCPSVESIASDLSSIGYGTHVVHNNTATFYSRNNAFSKMGFDTFTSKELMNITEYTPSGSWPTDKVLVNETVKAMDATENQSDFVYTITVGSHGDYPTEKIIENPEITVTGAADEASNNQWEYYVNMIHNTDNFIANLIDAVNRRGEDTIIVMFGDHLPTMGLEDSDMKSGDIFKTKYATWNNFGLPKQDADLTAYQLLAHITGQMGIHEGTMFTYTQTQADSSTYQNGLDNLQYDLLYGERYAYNGEDLYPATDLVMDVEDVNVTSVRKNVLNNTLAVYGSNFTKNAKIFVNGEKVPTTYLTSGLACFISVGMLFL